MNHEAYPINDLLTLAVAMPEFPNGFIAFGRVPGKIWCLQEVMRRDKVYEQVRREAMKPHIGALILYPDKAAAYAAYRDQADPVCAACGLAVLEHS